MALSDGLAKAFNDQITMEFSASHQYFALASWLEAENLPGFAHWMRLQSEEERSHGERFSAFVLDRGDRVRLGQIAAPRSEFASPLEVFEHALESERAVSASINALYGLALDQQDFASLPLLDWFVNEQVEEEAVVEQIVEDLRRIGDSAQALLMLDRELGERTAEPEA